MVSAVFSRKFLTLITKDDMITFVVLRMWRNWQTHKTQNLAGVTSCGFKSHHPQYTAQNLSDSGFAPFFAVVFRSLKTSKNQGIQLFY